MIEVSINKLNNIISEFDDYIEKLDKNNKNIIQEFNSIKNYWHDQRCINLFTSFNEEKTRIIKNAENIKEQRKLYEYIKNSYSKLGNEIKCNLESRELVLNKVDNVINNIKSTLNKYYNLGDVSFYSRASTIYNQKNKLKELLTALEIIKDKLKKKYTEIKTIENNINGMLNKNKIEIFVLNNYESEE